MRFAGKEPFPTIYVDGKEEGKVSHSKKSRYTSENVTSINILYILIFNES